MRLLSLVVVLVLVLALAAGCPPSLVQCDPANLASCPSGEVCKTADDGSSPTCVLDTGSEGEEGEGEGAEGEGEGEGGEGEGEGEGGGGVDHVVFFVDGNELHAASLVYSRP